MYNLLIIDDEQEIRNGLCNYFPWNELGFRISGQFENGRQALEHISKNHVDAMLCDIKMPVLTGIDLAKQLYTRKAHVKIVFLSGYKDFEYAKQALVYGVKDYIVKPTKYNELVDVFSKIKMELDEESLYTFNKEKADPEDRANTSLSYNEKVISTIKRHVIEHYKEVTLENAAELVRMNPYYLSRFFKEKTGQNFSDFLIKVKMEKAAEMLKDINYKTREISLMVGYSDSKGFSRMFTKYFGKSPREYRNRSDSV